MNDEMKVYLILYLDAKSFKFNDIPVDGKISILIPTTDYYTYVSLCGQHKAYKLKDIITGTETSSNLFDYIEEYTPTTSNTTTTVVVKEESLKDKMLKLQKFIVDQQYTICNLNYKLKNK